VLRIDFIKRAVMLSEAKHLLLLFLEYESKNDERFFAPLRMTSG
jgi:hypothetical protein